MKNVNHLHVKKNIKDLWNGWEGFCTMYRPQQAFAFDRETGYTERATDSLPAHGKKNRVVGGGMMLTLPRVWRHLLPDLFILVFYHFSIFMLGCLTEKPLP